MLHSTQAMLITWHCCCKTTADCATEVHSQWALKLHCVFSELSADRWRLSVLEQTASTLVITQSQSRQQRPTPSHPASVQHTTIGFLQQRPLQAAAPLYGFKEERFEKKKKKSKICKWLNDFHQVCLPKVTILCDQWRLMLHIVRQQNKANAHHFKPNTYKTFDRTPRFSLKRMQLEI